MNWRHQLLFLSFLISILLCVAVSLTDCSTLLPHGNPSILVSNSLIKVRSEIDNGPTVQEVETALNEVIKALKSHYSEDKLTNLFRTKELTIVFRCSVVIEGRCGVYCPGLVSGCFSPPRFILVAWRGSVQKTALKHELVHFILWHLEKLLDYEHKHPAWKLL